MPEEFNYRGWIPVLSGYISFRNACGQVIHSRCGIPKIQGDLSAHSGLWVEQQRELRDEIVTSLSWKPDRNRAGAITGKFLFYMQARWADNKEKDICGFVHAHPETAANLALNARDIPSIAGIHTQYNGWTIGFRLSRCGLIDLNWGELIPETALAIIDCEYSQPAPEEVVNRLTSQTYLFLKDLIHSHKFHTGDDDSVLVPYRVKDAGDISWGERTARNLHASIVTLMRKGRYDQLNAIGQTAYLKSFLRVADQHLSGFDGFDEASLDALLAGCDAKLEREKLAEAEKSSFGAIVLTLVFSSVAVPIGMLELLQLPCIAAFQNTSSCPAGAVIQLSPTAVTAAQLLLSNWVWSVLSILGVVLCVVFLFFGNTTHDIVSQRVGHRRPDWLLLRPVFGQMLAKHGRIFATIWVLLFVGLVLFLLWVIIRGALT